MSEPSPRPPAARPTLLVVTDLDGTLLDPATYSFEEARPALAALARSGARLVLASSKTRAEMEPLAAEVGGRPPLIVENGGALFLPAGESSYEVVRLGVARDRLVVHLAELAHEVGAAVRGFADFTPRELMRRTGLREAAARRALDREYDEPFELADEALLPALTAAAARRGLEVSRGGRFFHLTGGCDKGRALGHLLSQLAEPGLRFLTVGLGDAGNDRQLLAAVDRPILVPRPDGRLDETLASVLPQAERAPAPGPAGWNAALLAVFGGRRLPRVSDDFPSTRRPDE